MIISLSRAPGVGVYPTRTFNLAAAGAAPIISFTTLGNSLISEVPSAVYTVLLFTLHYTWPSDLRPVPLSCCSLTEPYIYEKAGLVVGKCYLLAVAACGLDCDEWRRPWLPASVDSCFFLSYGCKTSKDFLPLADTVQLAIILTPPKWYRGYRALDG